MDAPTGMSAGAGGAINGAAKYPRYLYGKDASTAVLIRKKRKQGRGEEQEQEKEKNSNKKENCTTPKRAEKAQDKTKPQSVPVSPTKKENLSSSPSCPYSTSKHRYAPCIPLKYPSSKHTATGHPSP